MLTKDSKTNETLIDLRIDNLSRKRSSCLFIVVFVLVLQIYIISLAFTPRAFVPLSGADTCSYNDQLYQEGICKKFDIRDAQAKQVSSTNEDPWNPGHAANVTYKAYALDIHERNYVISMDLTAVRCNEIHTTEAFAWQVSYYFSLLHRDKNNRVSTLYDKKLEKVTFQCPEIKDTNNDKQYHCHTEKILHFNEVKVGDYEIIFEFQDVPGWRGLLYLFEFKATVYSLGFISFMLCMRYFFVIVSVVALGFFYKNVGYHKTPNRSFEQKYVFWLSCLLPFSNDVLAFINIRYPNMITILISCGVTGVFIAYVILFWLVMLKRIVGEQNNTNTTKLTIWTKLFVFMIFFINLCAVMMVNYEYINDPAYRLQEDHPEGYKAMMFLLALTYFIQFLEILFGFWAIMKVWKSRLSRHKTFQMLSLYFMIAIIVIQATGIGHYYQTEGAGILSSIAQYNLYILCQQYLYSFDGVGKEKESMIKGVNQRYQENSQYAYMEKLEDDQEEDNKTVDNFDDLDNEIVDFEFGKFNPEFMNAGERNPDKMKIFSNNKTNLERDEPISIKPIVKNENYEERKSESNNNDLKNLNINQELNNDILKPGEKFEFQEEVYEDEKY